MPPKPKGAWTEAEKYKFLMQVIKQLGGQKLSIKYEKLEMPGRTPKALSEMWAKMKKDIEASTGEEGENDGEEMSTPVKSTPVKATPVKATPSKANKSRKPSPKKAKTTKVTPAKRKMQDSDDENEEEVEAMPDLYHGDTSESDVDGGFKREDDESALEEEYEV